MTVIFFYFWNLWILLDPTGYYDPTILYDESQIGPPVIQLRDMTK